MSIPTYAVVNDLPAPVTTGTTIQSFTDVWGEVWVAKNGVNGGNWLKARDVLHGKIARAGAWNTSTTIVQFSYDTIMRDTYGMAATGGSYWVVPIPGWWLWVATLSSAVAAGAGFMQGELRQSGAPVAEALGVPAASGPGGLTCNATAMVSVFCAAGDTLQLFQRASTSVTGGVGSNYVYSDLNYMGTG